MKHLFNIYLEVIPKNDTFEFPEGMSHFLSVIKPEDLYVPYLSYEHLINFRKEKAFIIFMPLDQMKMKDIILNLIEENYGFTIKNLREITRKKEHVFLRYMFFYLMKNNTKLSLGAIGAILSKDHTTVLHGLEAVKNSLEADRGWRNEYATNIIKRFNEELENDSSQKQNAEISQLGESKLPFKPIKITKLAETVKQEAKSISCSM